jgi:hypothetical protein
MAQLSEKLHSIHKTTKEQRRFVPESEVERLLDEASKRIKAESNELLAQQAASAHLLKYKAKKGRRLAAHLRLQNDRLKQAVEDEQQKFRQLKEALRRRTEQFDKLRITHLAMEEKVTRLEAKVKKQAAALLLTHTSIVQSEGGATQAPMMLMPPPINSFPLPDSNGTEAPTVTRHAPGLQQRAKTPLGTSRPNVKRSSYKFRPSSAPGTKQHEDHFQEYPHDTLLSEHVKQFNLPPHSVAEVSEEDDVLNSGAEEDVPPPTFGTTQFAEQNQLDSSGQEFTDEDRQTEDEDVGPVGDNNDIQQKDSEEAYDHFPEPSDEMHDRSMLPLIEERFTSNDRYVGNIERPASSPLRRSDGIPPLHGRHRTSTAKSVDTNRQMASHNFREIGTEQNKNASSSSEGGDYGRPSTAPELGTSSNIGFQPRDHNNDGSLSPVQDDEEAENMAIDQFLDEGDRLRPNSAPVSPTKKSSKKKSMFPKRQPKKRDNAKAAIEDARRLKEEKEEEEKMRLNALRKTWLRAIQDEPLESGIDKYAYRKRRKWVALTVCQGFQCHGSAVRRHGCFGLTLIGAFVFGTFRSFGANQISGFYAATAEFCVVFLGLLSYFALYNIVVTSNSLMRLMTYAFSDRRPRAQQNKVNLQWKYYVIYLQIIGALLMIAYSVVTVLGSSTTLTGLSLFMYIIGTPSLVWFTILTVHLLGLFWFSQSQTVAFIKEHNPMKNKKDPNVEDFFRIHRFVETMTETFGKHFVVPHITVSLIGLCACVSGLSEARKNEVSFELVILGVFFSFLLISLLSTGGRITAAADSVFAERSMHNMEMLKSFQGQFKVALLQLSGANTNDILCKCHNELASILKKYCT